MAYVYINMPELIEKHVSFSPRIVLRLRPQRGRFYACTTRVPNFFQQYCKPPPVSPHPTKRKANVTERLSYDVMRTRTARLSHKRL